MTLIVSVRTPVGIVVAADRLVQADVEFTEADGSTSRYPVASQFEATKLHHFQNGVTVGFYGRSIPGLAGGLLNILANCPVTATEGMEDSVRTILRSTIDLGLHLPSKSDVSGLHISGFLTDTLPCTVTVPVYQSMQSDVPCTGSYGYEFSPRNGQAALLEKMWNAPGLKQPDPSEFSDVRTAIDFATFFVRTVGTVQKFGTNIPSVGTNIDVRLIRPDRTCQEIPERPLTYERDHSTL